MDLVIGGAYQGKLAYAKEQYHLTDEDIFLCTESDTVDFTKRCVAAFERYLLSCVRTGTTPALDFRDDAVVVMRDISGGVVPVEQEIRLWREWNGRVIQELAAKSRHVTRIFCGLPQRLK